MRNWWTLTICLGLMRQPKQTKKGLDLVAAEDWLSSVNPIFDLAKLIFEEKFLVDLAIK